jgi:hypothetical protein
MPEGVVRECFQPLKGGRFPVRFPKDEEGNLLVNEKSRNIFGVARPGDHPFCPFQCELCHFQNLQGRSSMEGAGKLGDMEILKCLRRVNLDAFWSREPSTISHYLGKVSRALQIAHELGMRDPPSIPKLGPWELKDEFGAGEAIIVVTHSLDSGVTEDAVQYETVRKMKFAFVNMYHVSVENKGVVIIGGGRWGEITHARGASLPWMV